MRFTLPLLPCLLLCGLGRVAAAAPEPGDGPSPLQYSVSFSDADRHLIHVEMLVPTGGAAEVELMMPVWTPGSYLVREYARHIEAIEASDPRSAEALEIRKTRKNRWTVACPSGSELIRVRYRLYCREMSVRTNWVEHAFGCLNGAATFLTLADDRQRQHRVRCVLPSHWSQAISALPTAPGESTVFVAESFDVLVDSPIVLGNPQVAEFTVDDVPHRLVTINDAGLWDNDAAARDVQRIVEAQRDFWGQLPYEHYTFLNVVGESGGGLEHDNSTLLMTRRWTYRDPDSYRGWLGLVSHELFHAWNVRRLRPMALRSYDYENENYFDELWIAEGVTSYYDDLLQRRAGLLTRKDYLRRLGRTLERVMEAPGVRVQSLRASSYDTWIKHYRPDENSVNARISYYTKGALVAWLLDAKIRTATKNEKSLDDVMRLLYQRHLDDGYSLAKFRAAVDEVAGEPLSEFLARAVDQTEMLDFQPAANFWGLQLGSDTPSPTAEAAGPATAEADAAARDSTDEPTTNQPESAGDAPRDEPAPTAAAATAAAPEAPFIGASVRDRGGRLVIARVLRDSPADRAGWNVDDELVGIEQFRASESLWNNRLRYFPVGEPLKTLLSRRGQLIERTLVPAPAAEARWRLRFLDKPTDPQQTRRDAWLGVTITSAPGTDAVATEP